MSNVSSLSLSDLPALPRAVVEAARPLARLVARHPRELQVTLRAVGVVTLRVVRVRLASAGAGPADHTARDLTAAVDLRLRLPGGVARLTIDLALARAAIAAVLGLRLPMIERPLGRTERGVVAALVAQIVKSLGGSDRVRVGLDEPETVAPRPGTAVAAADIEVRAAGVTGLVRIELTADQVLGVAGGLHPDRLAELVLPLALELARTTLSAADFAGLSPGDAIVFEGSRAVVGVVPEAWPVTARMGGVCVPARFDAEGGVRAVQAHAYGLEAAINMSKDMDAAPTAAVTAALAAVPVEVVAEVGRLTVRADELAGLLAGSVLALQTRRSDAVTLRVGDRAWARGELVNVDGELGVRVTEILR